MPKQAVVIEIPNQGGAIARLMFGSQKKCRVKCDAATGCWKWLGAVAPNGYGRVGYNNKVLQAHRFAYSAIRGDLDPRLDLDHLCRNRKCVNPWHMEQVSRAVNTRRGLKTKLTKETVDLIRSRWAAGGVTQSALGREYGVGSDVISEIVNGKIWRDA